MKVNSFDEVDKEYVKEIKAVKSKDELMAVLNKYTPLVPDAIGQAKDLSWEDYQRASMDCRIEGVSPGKVEKAMKLVGNILMPDILMEVTMLAGQFCAPWGLTFNRCVELGVIELRDGAYYIKPQEQNK